MNLSSKREYVNRAIHGEYYPHIDGIRALAVLPVVLYHIGVSLCPGGFAGVDVFFVISGYLITGGILRELESGRFSIRSFYHRRIRRILPAYFALISGVFVIGCTVYYSLPLIRLADATVMGTLFSANLYFWKMGGDYFAPEVHNNPLLHLWSLSVEEQFYIFIPVLFAVLWKKRKRFLLPVLGCATFLSFAAAVCVVSHGKQDSAFYLLQYRAWELLSGSLLAMFERPTLLSQEPVQEKAATEQHCISCYIERICHGVPEWLKRWQSVEWLCPATLGLLLVLTPYAVLTSNSPFPGFAAFPSVAGTVLLIRYGSKGWVNRVLSCRPFVATGKVSYSLYLWHWPVIVFWRYLMYDQLRWPDYSGMFLVSLVTAVISWRFVELPARISVVWTARRSFLFSAVGVFLLVLLGLSCVFQQGWPRVLHPSANKWYSSLAHDPASLESVLRGKIRRVKHSLGLDTSAEQQAESEARFSWGDNGVYEIGSKGYPVVYLIGDSHASALRYGFDVALKQKGLCGIAMSYGASDMFNLSQPRTQTFLEDLAKHPTVNDVFIAEYWSDERSDRCRPSCLEGWFSQLEGFSLSVKSLGKQLYVLSDIPVRDESPCEMVSRTAIIAPRKVVPGWVDGVQTEDEYLRTQGEINRRLVKLCEKTGAIFLPVHQAFNQNGHYIAFAYEDGGLRALYRDRDHLSRYGSLRAAHYILNHVYEKKQLHRR